MTQNRNATTNIGRSAPGRSRAGAALLALGVCVCLSAGPAEAQTMPSLGGQSPDGVGGLLQQAMPSVSGAGAANTAGVLSYCVKNNLVSGNGATSVLNSLSGRSEVQSSGAFALGQQGQLETGNGNMFSLAGLKGQVKSKLCDQVLQHAQSLL